MFKKISRKKILFFTLFIILGIISFRIPFTHIMGSKQTFTAFSFLSPITGGFLGSWLGAAAIALVQGINIALKNTPATAIAFLQFLPAVAAALYFGSKTKWINLIPLLCIILFLAHPIGRAAWYYPLAFWFIPVLTSFGKHRLSLNALGSTFTAHAVGSTIYLYAFGLPVTVWRSLMTIVPVERVTFAVGIVVSYLVINSVLDYLVKKFNFTALDSLVNHKLTLNSKSIKQVI